MVKAGDPLSPILFNIIVDMLAIIINRANEDGEVGCLLQYDDAVYGTCYEKGG
jgi:hypothetical protein